MQERPLCEKVQIALRRNGLTTVHCEHEPKGLRLSGTVASEEDRAIAFAIARTTIGTTSKMFNRIQVDRR